MSRDREAAARLLSPSVHDDSDEDEGNGYPLDDSFSSDTKVNNTRPHWLPGLLSSLAGRFHIHSAGRVWRRYLIAGVLVFILLLTIAFSVFAYIRHVKRPFQRVWPSFVYGDGQKYCTTWPVEKLGENKYVLPAGFDDAFTSENRPAFNQSLGGPTRQWEKPTDMRVVAHVFYGRRQYVDLLDCYLQRNLAANGGYLDEVVFLANTHNLADLDFLDDLVDRTAGYSRVNVSDICTERAGAYSCMWESATDPNTIYVKLDDDIVYVHEEAIPSLVHTLLRRPEAFAVGANLINSYVMSWPHWHTGAIQAYLPEANHRPRSPEISWRASELPAHSAEAQEEPDYRMTPPFYGHRWLPIPKPRTAILKTPVHWIETDGGLGSAVRSWGIGAQQLYSLLHNIETSNLQAYTAIGDADGLWYPQYRRYNVNFFAIWGSDVAANLPIDRDDEQAMTVTLPRRTGRPFLVDSKCLVGHLHFGPQTEELLYTDLLDRFRAFANENVCNVGQRRMPMGPRCPGF